MLLDYEKRTNWKRVVQNHVKERFGEEAYFLHPRTSKYLISNTGKIKSLYNGKILKSHTNQNGYQMVNIVFDNGTRRNCMIHRLVMETFVSVFGGDEINYEVNHMDANKNNNALNNLEWMTRSENLQHARDNGLFKNTRNGKVFKLTDSQVNEILEFRKLGFTIKEIAASYRVSRCYTSKLIKTKGERRRKWQI